MYIPLPILDLKSNTNAPASKEILMTKAYKLTNELTQTHNNTQWVLQEFKETSGKGNLCGPGWLHYYSDATLAAFLNPMHANFAAPRLFEIEVQGLIKEDHGLKYGCTKMRLVQELQFIKPTVEQCIKFGILCALEVYKDAAFIKWANSWLDGTDRSIESARAAAADARAARAAYAADAAGAAARAAADAYADADAARAAARAAAWAARSAADAAADAAGTLDLVAIAHKAMEGTKLATP
jgi:hypothetical protein